MTISKPRKAILDKVPVKYLACRDLGHWWFWYDVTYKGRRVFQLLQCQKCKSIKVKKLAKDFKLKGSHINYVKDFKVEGMGRLNAEERAYLRRRLEEYMEAEKVA